ncbi:MAG: cytochrome ubiquinol oxidase subunit I [Candidimonas sp.]|nr:MAG: cytochrome ubiquinol oxidase subunit I [Candidimonas sp.]TAM20214.1 MAG: cytochrome ubiquinol oxidase subunit I [Candidimonas sp.]TAM76178.1 MAG: cytochrome ubiquinol oxidase subunit I [Candidimonas sp.]
MTNSALWLSQIQFFLSLGFLALFLVIELGLAWVLLFFKLCAHCSGQPAWTTAYRFWVRVFALAFVLTFASSMPVLIQFGSLWPSLMDKIGEIAGPLLAASIVTTFIFKSCFLGAMLFGQSRISDRMHTLVVFMVAVGVTLAAWWMVILLSWMQTPDGANMIDGQYHVISWADVLFNPSAGWYAALFAISAALTVAFLMLGVTAGQTLRRPPDESERLVFKTALVVAMVAVLLQGVAGWGAAAVIARHQPAKAAATAAYWHSGVQPGLVLFGWPDTASQRNRYAWEWRHAGGRWLGRDDKGQLQGLDHFSGKIPPVALVFWSFRLTVLVGLLMTLASWLTYFRVRKKHYDPSMLSVRWRRFLRLMMFSGWLGSLTGLAYSLFGLYPYAVNQTVSFYEIAGTTDWTVLLGAGVVYLLFYAALMLGFLQLLRHIARYGVVPVARRRGRA